MKGDPTFWILARASGLTAYLLLTASVLLGLLVKSRPFGRAIRPAAVTDVHRFVTLLGLGAIAVHGVTLVLDRTVEIPLEALLLPGVTAYRPLWTGLGVIAAELTVLIVVSFSLRRVIGGRNWRRLHWATYLTFVLATIHGLLAGSDTGQSWAAALYASSCGAVAAAATWRAFVPPARPARPASSSPGRPARTA